MHRVARPLFGPLMAAMLGLGVGACASKPEEVPEPAEIEKLRLSITKTRNAIRETRQTIARSQGSPALPELYVRLAELLSEEARYHNQVAYEREERKSRLMHAPEVQLLKNQAIAVYKDVLNRFPDSPLGPRVRFNMGHELRELGEFDEMVKVLEELVAKHPQSPLAGEALLVLGDYHFDKSELDQAGAKYTAISKRPLSRVSSLAQYKLGWVDVNEANCPGALAAFEAALEASGAWAKARLEHPDSSVDPRRATIEGGADTGDDEAAPGTAQSIDVRREALVDLVYCYTQQKDVMQAVPYLRARAANRAGYVAALRRMAERLSLMNRPDAGLPVARELQRLAAADADRLDDARVLYTFLRHELKPEIAPGGKTPPPTIDRFLFRAEDVRLITGSLLRWAELPGLTDEVRTAARDEFERYVRDILTTAQERAQTVTTGRDVALNEVADGYIVYLDAFPAAAEKLSMSKNLADVLSLAERHYEAGMTSLDVAAMETDGAARQAALLDAVSELQKALQQKGSRREVERVVARAALRRAGLELLGDNRFASGQAPAPKKRVGPLSPKGEEPPAIVGAALTAERLRAVKFAIALTYFDEGRFREAIDRFTALAYEYPGTEESTTALFLALDAYDAEGDYDGLIAMGQRFAAPDSPATADAKAKIAPAIARAEQRKLDELALAAAGTGGTNLSELERFSQRYAGTSLGERALVNAFVAARAQGDADAVQRLGQDIVAKYPGSEQTTGIISTMARSALANLDYDRAVTAFEQAANAPGGDAVPLLLAAADIHSSLGDAAGAEQALQKALGQAKTPAVRAQVGAKLAALLEERGASPDEVLRVLGPLAADKEPRVLADLGLAQVSAGQSDQAEVTLQGVLGGQSEATTDAKARAHYGSAEALGKLVGGFQADGSLDALNELTALVDLIEETYLAAARDGDPVVTPVALGRLATTAKMAATKLRSVNLPGDLSASDRDAIQKGLGARAKQLEDLATGAISTCAGQAWTTKLFEPAVRKCLAGQPLTDARLVHDVVKPRQRSGAAVVPEPLKQKLSENPENPEAIIAVGTALLDGGDPHTARLVLARAAGSGAQAQNLMGIAHYQVGDYTSALEAFAHAADAGSLAGRSNLKSALSQLGLSSAGDEVEKHWPNAKDTGGRLLGGGTQ